MLAKRTLSAVIIALAAILMILTGGWTFTIGIAMILAISVWEYIRMFNQGGYHPSPITAAAGTLVITSARNLADPAFLNAALIAVFFAIAIQHIARSKYHQDTAAVDFAIDLSVLVFISFPGSFLVDIRNLPDGLYWTLVCFFSTALGDIGAFAIGSLIGKHKLAPLISPNKSVEGYLGGIAAACLGGLATGLIARGQQVEMSLLWATGIGFAIGAISPLGDLSKSIFKRAFSLKDTGDLIPGHGGMLDRIDTILWAAPIAFFLIHFLVK